MIFPEYENNADVSASLFGSKESYDQYCITPYTTYKRWQSKKKNFIAIEYALWKQQKWHSVDSKILRARSYDYILLNNIPNHEVLTI